MFLTARVWYSCDMLMRLMVCKLLLRCVDGNAGGLLDAWFTMFIMKVLWFGALSDSCSPGFIRPDLCNLSQANVTHS